MTSIASTAWRSDDRHPGAGHGLRRVLARLWRLAALLLVPERLEHPDCYPRWRV